MGKLSSVRNIRRLSAFSALRCQHSDISAPPLKNPLQRVSFRDFGGSVDLQFLPSCSVALGALGEGASSKFKPPS